MLATIESEMIGYPPTLKVETLIEEGILECRQALVSPAALTADGTHFCTFARFGIFKTTLLS